MLKSTAPLSLAHSLAPGAAPSADRAGADDDNASLGSDRDAFDDSDADDDASSGGEDEPDEDADAPGGDAGGDEDAYDFAPDLDLGAEDGDEGEDEDLADFRKLDMGAHRASLLDAHPELVQHSYEEIEARCAIARGPDGAIDDPAHRTAPFLTKFERARAVGERAKQIDAGAEPFVDVPPHVIDSYAIAMQEYAEKKIPFIVKRPLPNGDVEYWRLADLEH